jgi:hypothetical protein
MIVIRPPRFQRRAKLAGLSEYDIVEISGFSPSDRMQAR